jgi:hypothetical protein
LIFYFDEAGSAARAEALIAKTRARTVAVNIRRLGLVRSAESDNNQRLIETRTVPLQTNRPNLSITPLVKGWRSHRASVPNDAVSRSSFPRFDSKPTVVMPCTPQQKGNVFLTRTSTIIAKTDQIKIKLQILKYIDPWSVVLAFNADFVARLGVGVHTHIEWTGLIRNCLRSSSGKSRTGRLVC